MYSSVVKNVCLVNNWWKFQCLVKEEKNVFFYVMKDGRDEKKEWTYLGIYVAMRIFYSPPPSPPFQTTRLLVTFLLFHSISSKWYISSFLLFQTKQTPRRPCESFSIITKPFYCFIIIFEIQFKIDFTHLHPTRMINIVPNVQNNHTNKEINPN